MSCMVVEALVNTAFGVAKVGAVRPICLRNGLGRSQHICGFGNILLIRVTDAVSRLVVTRVLRQQPAVVIVIQKHRRHSSQQQLPTEHRGSQQPPRGRRGGGGQQPRARMRVVEGHPECSYHRGGGEGGGGRRPGRPATTRTGKARLANTVRVLFHQDPGIVVDALYYTSAY